jgi:hypothetical protein
LDISEETRKPAHEETRKPAQSPHTNNWFNEMQSAFEVCNGIRFFSGNIISLFRIQLWVFAASGQGMLLLKMKTSKMLQIGAK